MTWSSTAPRPSSTTASTTATTATATATAGGRPRILQNPYAQRKPPPEIFKDPLHIDEDATPGTSSAEDDAATTLTTVLGRTTSNEPTVEETLCPDAPVHAAEKEEASKLNGAGAASLASILPPRNQEPAVSDHLPTTRSGDVPSWERLPSRSLSFSSAEIVTVPELLHERQQPGTARNLRNNEGREATPKPRSVRVMGVVTHKLVHSDASVSLVLRDPLSSSSSSLPQRITPQPKGSVKQPSSIRPSKFQRLVPQPAAPMKSSHPSSTAKPTTPAAVGRPATGSADSGIAPATTSAPRQQQQQQQGRTATATPVVRSMIRPQPLRSRSAAPSSGGNSISTLTASHKRPWSAVRPIAAATAPPPDPLQLLAALVVNRETQSDSLWVLVRPGYDSVNPLAVGDLVTVIGEVHWVPSDDFIHDGAASIPEAVRQVLAAQTSPPSAEEKQQLQEQKEFRMGAASANSPFTVMYLLARILLASNGMNAGLFVQALNARRQLLAN